MEQLNQVQHLAKFVDSLWTMALGKAIKCLLIISFFLLLGTLQMFWSVGIIKLFQVEQKYIFLNKVNVENKSILFYFYFT